jgi:hypothetical protein
VIWGEPLGLTYTVQWLIDSGPPSVSWSRPTPPQSNQPTLDFADHEVTQKLEAGSRAEAYRIARENGWI